jgi:Flp pilus assembly pilin Flp
MKNYLLKLYVTLTEYPRGQTMTEYALILATIAVAAYVAYQGLGTKISDLANTVAGDL